MATAGTAATFRPSVSASSESTLLRSPFKLPKFTPLPSSRSRSSSSFSVSCTVAKDPTVLMTEAAGSDSRLWQRPDSFGRFGKFGGKYVPETLMHALSELETAFYSLASDEDFQRELAEILKDYVGRESPLYFAERLTEHYRRENGEGPLIYLKREDLNHTGAHKINNAVAQALLDKRLGKKRIIAETGAGQHGVATATVCARFGLQCIIYMGAQDMERQALNVFRMRLLGAEVRGVHSGTATLKDATSEAIRDWVTNVETTHYILGSVAGPHPYPMMVRDFHAVIGKETRRQAMEKWGGKPDVLVACVGGGSNAMGLFHEFVDDTEIRMIGVEAAGFGLDSGKHAATLTKGDVGVLHGAMSYLLQDDDGQIIEPHSISAGLDYPGVGPEHSFLKDVGRAEYYSVTDEEALEEYNFSLHCQKPSWEKAAKQIKERYDPEMDGRVVLAKVDCTQEGDLCRRNHIQGYPSIRIFRKGSDLKDDNAHHEHESYYGDRDTESLVKMVVSLVEPIHLEPHNLALEDKSDNSSRTLKKAPSTGGCRIEGYMRVKKVPGNLMVSARSGSHSFDSSEMNMSHVVNHLSFGRRILPQKFSELKRLSPYLGRNHDRLDGRPFINQRDLGPNVTIEHYLQIVKTEVVKSNGQVLIEEYEYTAHSSVAHSYYLPVAKFHFELSPMQVLITENSKSFSHFITNVCAIIGGVFTVAGILDSILHHTMTLMKKIELGKNF